MTLLYQYECRQCGFAFEWRRAMEARNNRIYCPHCKVWDGYRVQTAAHLHGSPNMPND